MNKRQKKKNHRKFFKYLSVIEGIENVPKGNLNKIIPKKINPCSFSKEVEKDEDQLKI